MKILIIKPSSLGDVIHSLPFLKAVKETFPDAHIDWVISKNLKGIIEGNPLINGLIIFDKDSWKNIKNLPKTSKDISLLRKTLRTRHYDMVVDLQGLLRSGLIALLTPTSLKIGFDNAREGSRYLYDRKISVNGISHAVDKCLKLAKAIGARTTKIEFPLHIDNTTRKKVKELIRGITEYIIMAPSARWHTKRWPAEYFASLTSKLSVPCVVTGTNADKEIIQKIIKDPVPDGTGQNREPSGSWQSTEHRRQTTEPITQKSKRIDNIINLCGKTDLKELIALIAGAKAVISNDSGPMHIAAALNVPVIALFGPTDPIRTGPYGWEENKNSKVLRASVPCSPCFKKRCKEPVCMSNISVEAVFEALKGYL